MTEALTVLCLLDGIETLEGKNPPIIAFADVFEQAFGFSFNGIYDCQRELFKWNRVDQWKKSLEQFLEINEVLPEPEKKQVELFIKNNLKKMLKFRSRKAQIQVSYAPIIDKVQGLSDYLFFALARLVFIRFKPL